MSTTNVILLIGFGTVALMLGYLCTMASGCYTRLTEILVQVQVIRR